MADNRLSTFLPNRSVMGAKMLPRPAEPYLREQYPEVYGALSGLMGTAPDEQGSVLDPNTARARAGAEIGFPLGTALQMLPFVKPAAAGVKALGPTAGRMAEGYLQRQGLMPGVVESAAIPSNYEVSSVLMNPKNLMPLNKIEDAEKYKNILSSMQESGYQGRPILAYMDENKAKALTGSHRLYAARKAGIEVPVVFVKPSVMKWEDNKGLFGTFKESINDQRVYEHLKAAGDDTAASLAKLEDVIDSPILSKSALKAEETFAGFAPPEKTLRIYRGSHVESPEYSVEENYRNDIYGGVFGSSNINAARSHGSGTVHFTDIPENKILTHYDLNYEIPYEQTKNALLKARPDLKNNQELFDELYDVVVGDAGQDLSKFDKDKILDLLRKSGSEAENEAQKLRGKVAKNLGYKAVEMTDEHGSGTYLVVPGARFKSAQQNSLNSFIQ